MTTWGAESGHEAVGINVFTDAYNTNTPTINVYWDFYARSVNWGFQDNQTLGVSGSVSGTFNFYFNVGGGIADQYVGRLIIYNQGQNYSGGPTYSVTARISGSYLGATPYCAISYRLPARPPNVPTSPGVSVSNVTSTSATINVTAADGRGSAINDYETQVDNDSNFSSPLDDFHGGTGTVTNLSPAVTYYARSRAHNGVGWGAWSGTVSFKTGATVPGAPTGLNATNVDQATATINWTAPANDGGSGISGYDVQYATDSAFTVGLKTVSDNASPYNMTALTPGQRYYVRVRAKNAVGASAWTTSINFTTLSGTPVIISPTTGSSVSAALASVTVTALGIASDRTITVQLSQASDFSTVAHTLTLNPGAATSNNQYKLSDSYYLKVGTWYARAKVTNNTTGYVTPWSGTVSWTEAHTPSAALVSPTGGGTASYTPNVQFQWRFSDAAGAGDKQSAYQIVIENNNNGTTIYDSDKVLGQAVSVSVAIDPSLKNTALRWRVRVWDQGDTASAWTSYGIFTLADTPVITIIDPAPAIPVDTGSPTFSWSVTIPSGGTQAGATIDVYEATTNNLVWHNEVTGAITEMTPPVVILQNQTDYTFTLKVTDSTGLSSSATSSFTTSYEVPNSISYGIDASGAEELGYVLVDWTDALPDDEFASWKVYRKDMTVGNWELIATITDINVRTYKDYMLCAGSQYVYSATQVATRSGALLESPVGFWQNDQDQSVIEDRRVDIDLWSYWIINPDDTSLSVKLLNVIKDSTTLEFESETYTIIGRGRHTDYGDELGYSGSLTCQVRIPERPSSFRKKIESMRRANETYYLRTPFGALFQVSLGDIGWDPIAGVGTSEMGDMTIPYEQVA